MFELFGRASCSGQSTSSIPSMPPRLSLFTACRIRNASVRGPTLQRCCFSTTPTPAAQIGRRRTYDPYAIAQARARKAANISRQQTLQSQRKVALGDPVRGLTTPFVESFDTATSPAVPPPLPSERPHHPPQPSPHLAYKLRQSDLDKGHERSLSNLAISLKPIDNIHRQNIKVNEDAAHALEAMTRILRLDAGSAADRLRANKQRCIETFGRHRTDSVLEPKPVSPQRALNPVLEPGVNYKTPRAGPDTGSSEVQIAILTAKIRALTKHLETTGRTDVMNKRNLRLLVHKRQKLLVYLRRKERGGERWQYLVNTLGLTEGTWRGEISL